MKVQKMKVILYDDYLDILGHELNAALAAKQVYLSKRDTAAAFMIQGVISCITATIDSLEDPECSIVLDVDRREDESGE